MSDGSGLRALMGAGQPTPALAPQATPAAAGDSLKALLSAPEQGQGPVRTPDEEASNTRQMLVSGLTGMPTPNMTAEEKAQFEQGKATGALSVPAVAAATTGAAMVPEVIGSAAKAALPHVVALGNWAEANPGMAKILLEGIKLAGWGGALAMIRRMGQ